MMPTAGPSGQGPTNPQVPPLPSPGNGAGMIPGVALAPNRADYINNPDSIPKLWGDQAPTIPPMPTRPSAPPMQSQQSNAAVAAAHAAAAAAAAAAGAPNMPKMPKMPSIGAPLTTNQAHSNGFVAQPSKNINSGAANNNGHDNGNANGNADEDGAIRAAQMKRRKQLLDERVEQNRLTYRHPKGSHEETIIFHRARALLEITNLSQTFICQRTSITNAALSQYLRCCFKGRQDTLEDKLEVFITDYLNGKYDGDARKLPAGRRKSASDANAGPSRRYTNNNINMALNNSNGNPANAISQMSPANGATQAEILNYQHQLALLQQQQQALMRQHQHQYVAAAAAAAKYKNGSVAARQYTNQRVAAGQAYNNRQYQQAYATHQQYALQQQLVQQQHYRQQQAYQNQIALRYRQNQVAAANAAAAAQAAAPQLKPLPPTVAVEKAYHAYQSANLDITSTNAEPLLISIEINVQLEDGEGLDNADVQQVSKDAQSKGDDTQKNNTKADNNSVSDTATKSAEGTGNNAENPRADPIPPSDPSNKNVSVEKSNPESKAAAENGIVPDDNSSREENGNNDVEQKEDGNLSVGQEIVNHVLQSVQNSKNAPEESKSSKVHISDKEQVNAERMDTQNSGNTKENEDAENIQEKSETGSTAEVEDKLAGKSKATDDDVEIKGSEKENEQQVDKDGDVNMEKQDDQESPKDGSTSPSKREQTGSTSNSAVTTSNSGAAGGASEPSKATGKESEGNTGGSECCAQVPAKPLSRSLRYLTQWDVNERRLCPEEVAENIIKEQNCEPALAKKVAFAIRRHLFEVRVCCAVPPCDREKENLRRISIRVPIIGDAGTEEGVIEDSFDWDVCMGEYNSAELFAQHICSDNGVSQYHVPQVAQAIRKQIMLAQAVSYGDEETAEKARKIINEAAHSTNKNRKKKEASVAEKLEARKHGVRRLTEAEKRELRENSILEYIMEPLFENVWEEIEVRERDNLQKRIAAAKHEEEERVRKEIEKKKSREMDAENSKARKKIMIDADKWSNELGARINPYLEVKLGRGDVPPSIWVEGLLMRKKMGHKILPGISDEEMQRMIDTAPSKNKNNSKKKGVKGKGTGRGRGRPRKNNNNIRPEKDTSEDKNKKGDDEKEKEENDNNISTARDDNNIKKTGAQNINKKPERKRRSSTRNAGSASKRTRR